MSSGNLGIAKEGFWGVGVKKGEQYLLTFWARGRSSTGGTEPLFAQLVGSDGQVISNTVSMSRFAWNWERFSGKLNATLSEPHALLQITTNKAGTVWFDMVSLFPKKTFKGRLNGVRDDIAKMIADLKPGFVRFPGGCVVESSTVETTYNWENTIGPLEQRQEVWNVWDYRRTSGMGIFEYLQFIEDLHAEPMYVGFAGQTCIFRSPTLVSLSAMGPFVDRFTELLEYANGPTSSKWGQARAKAGHPLPFNLKMMEIGNENVGDEYTQRYEMIYPKLKAAAPYLQTIANEPQRRSETDIVDEHFYSSPQWFMNNVHLYDGRDRRDPPVYIGELAATTDDTGKDRGNLRAALAEGAFLMGAERNSDVVKMVSYAPLLANVDGRTALAGAPPPWHGMIYFDSARTFGTASYYMWKMFAQNRPSENLPTTVNLEPRAIPVISGGIGVGTWETSAEFKDIKVEKAGKTLYSSDFSTRANGWQVETGDWAATDGSYRQSAERIGMSYFGDEAWSNYTLTLKARKIRGPEGFLIAFGHRSGERLWWNIGGWGNHEHAIELNQNPVGPRVPGSIETGRWYEIRVEIRANELRCFLDGKLIHDQTLVPPERFFAISGRDEKTGDLIVKVINATANPVSTTIHLNGSTKVCKRADLTVLTSGLQTDNNSLDYPDTVVPRSSHVEILSPRFSHDFLPFSLTVVRLKFR